MSQFQGINVLRRYYYLTPFFKIFAEPAPLMMSNRVDVRKQRKALCLAHFFRSRSFLFSKNDHTHMFLLMLYFYAVIIS